MLVELARDVGAALACAVVSLAVLVALVDVAAESERRRRR